MVKDNERPKKRPQVAIKKSPRSPLWTFSIIVAIFSALTYAFFNRESLSQFLDVLDVDMRELKDASVFRVMDLPGRGKGVVAIRDIKQGELVIQELPLFVVPQKINTSPSALISQLLGNVNNRQRQAFLNLSYVNFPPDKDPQKHPEEVALAIFQTNAVSAGDGVGIFPRMARLNHGCLHSFNVVYSWQKRERSLVVHAIRDIKKGQELLTTYTDTKRPMHERRAYLQDQYGFTCTCAACSLTGNALERSDRQVKLVAEHYRKLAAWSSGSISGSQAIDVVQDIWKLLDEIDYMSERGRLAADAAVVAASHSDIPAAREWTKLARHWYIIELGEGSDEVQQHGIPTSAWGSRESLQVGLPPTEFFSSQK